MFELIKGASFDDSRMLTEGFEINDDSSITANVSLPNIRRVFDEFIDIQQDKGFALFIEAPSRREDENPVGKTEDGYTLVEKLHKDVYYLDNFPADYARKLLDAFGEILINDGLSAFGFISQTRNEVGKYKYNVMQAYNFDGDISAMARMFENAGIGKVTDLRTAWQYFSDQTPGESQRYVVNGKSVYDVVEALKTVGMYKAEQRED